MTKERAMFILSEIKSIARYEKLIVGYDKDLERIAQQIKDIQTPSCPNNNQGIKVDNHKDKYSIINSLFADEMQYATERNELVKRVEIAKGYLSQVQYMCDEDELKFIEMYRKGCPHGKLVNQFGYSNPYRFALILVKRIKL